MNSPSTGANQAIVLNQAMVFVRRNAAYGIGHVGWTFAVEEGVFSAGAVENHHGGLITPAPKMGFWKSLTPNPIVPMRQRGYNEFKIITLEHADPVGAAGVVHWVSLQDYEALGRNCMDDSYDVLRTYGVKNLPLPATHWEPNYWFDAIVGEQHSIRGNRLHRLLRGLKRQQLPASTRTSAAHSPALPVMPAWRNIDEQESSDFQGLIRAVAPMPFYKKLHWKFLPFVLGAKCFEFFKREK